VGRTPLAQSIKRDVAVFEKQQILAALAECAGNQTHAARVLGISRATLVSRLDAYKIPRPRKPRG
jgi:DNA-binding NtrC family response regulator